MSRAKHAKGPQPVKVFLSHSSADTVFARRIRNVLLQHLNARVFTAEDLSAGGDWKSKLRNELKGADVVLALLTPHGASSNWVLQELGAAWALQKPIIPVVTRRGVLNTLPLELGHAIDLELKDLETPESADKFIDAFERTLAAAHAN